MPGTLSSDGLSEDADGSGSAGQAAAHLAITTVVESPNQALTKFWEVEEPPQLTANLTPEELKVQQHYSLTHTFVPSAGKYKVTLPRKSKAPALGESRSQALQRFKSNECSLLRKGRWEKFQAVVQEYLDLGHAQPVTQLELATPTQDWLLSPDARGHKGEQLYNKT